MHNKIFEEIYQLNESISKIEESIALLTARVEALENNQDDIVDDVTTKVDDKISQITIDVDKKCDSVKTFTEESINNQSALIQGDITSINNSITNLTDTIEGTTDKDGITTIVKNLVVTSDAVSNKLSDIDTQITAIDGNVSTLSSSTSTNITEIRNQLSGVKTMAETIQSKNYATLENVNEAHQEAMTAIGASNTKIDNLTTRVTSNESAITGFNTAVTQVSKRLDDSVTKLASLEKKFDLANKDEGALPLS